MWFRPENWSCSAGMRGAALDPVRRLAVYRMLCVGVWVSVFAATAVGQKPPLLAEKDVAALAQELSGETTKRNLEGITRNHRQRGSKGFHAAAEMVAVRVSAINDGDFVKVIDGQGMPHDVRPEVPGSVPC